MDPKFIDAARKEDWDYLDAKIPELVKDSSNIDWAYANLEDTNPNIRDYGASLLEKAVIPKERFQKFNPRIRKHMVNDSNPYVRFRCAFALAAHNNIDEDVVRVLKLAKLDQDVSDIAEEYLSRIQ